MIKCRYSALEYGFAEGGYINKSTGEFMPGLADVDLSSRKMVDAFIDIPRFNYAKIYCAVICAALMPAWCFAEFEQYISLFEKDPPYIYHHSDSYNCERDDFVKNSASTLIVGMGP